MDDLLLDETEIQREFAHPPGERRLSFADYEGSPSAWRREARAAFADLAGIEDTDPDPGRVEAVRRRRVGEIEAAAFAMRVDGFDLPGYLLEPPDAAADSAVIALHGHGTVGPCLGAGEDYHHAFALELARAGRRVLCPELRGFGALADLAGDRAGRHLDYWRPEGTRHFTLVTDGVQRGRTMVGQTVEDLLRWEAWLADRGVDRLDVAGVSYGGDLALYYPPYSDRVERIFASGTLGSFGAIFERGRNAPGHCVPGVLEWLDRADLAGLNAPRPLVAHYGAGDTPGPENWSAAYNDTVDPALEAVREIYRAFDAAGRVERVVSPDLDHEMDVPVLLDRLA